MKGILFVLGFLGCDDGQDLPSWCPDQHADEVDESLVAEPPQGPNSVAIWAPGEPWGNKYSQQAALAGCRTWEPVGFTCHLVADPKEADIVVDYVDAGCDYVARNDLFGSCDQKGTTWINTATECQPPDLDHLSWLQQLVAHEIGHSLLFVQEVPQFCGEAVMNPAIERFQEYQPISEITDADRNLCNNGVRSITLRTGVEVPINCGTERVGSNSFPIDVCAEPIETEPEVYTLWLEDGVLEWEEAIFAGCAWWDVVGVSCELAPSKEEADVVVRDQEWACSGYAGEAFKDSTLDGRWAIEFPDPCRDPEARHHVESDEEAEMEVEDTVAHEMGHVLGVDHVPYFCADAVMNPSGKTGRTCLTPADVAGWRERRPRP